MNDDELVTIGGFSLASGLSIAALRHYDEVGILVPADVDPGTGYRRYRLSQLTVARTVRALRRVQMPLDDVREVLEHRDRPDRVVPVLDRHRAALAARADELSEMVRVVDRYIDHGGVMSALESVRIEQVTINVNDIPEAVAFYVKAFGATYVPDISSLHFGEYPQDDFFLLTMERDEAFGPSRFGLTVGDVDAAHSRALAAGAVEVAAPYDAEWKPRSSFVRDPSGNLVSLFQGARG